MIPIHSMYQPDNQQMSSARSNQPVTRIVTVALMCLTAFFVFVSIPQDLALAGGSSLLFLSSLFYYYSKEAHSEPSETEEIFPRIVQPTVVWHSPPKIPSR